MNPYAGYGRQGYTAGLVAAARELSPDPEKPAISPRVELGAPMAMKSKDVSTRIDSAKDDQEDS